MRGMHIRLGSTMSEAMMSTMVSSDKELDQKRGGEKMSKVIVCNAVPSEHQVSNIRTEGMTITTEGVNNLKAGVSSRLVIPVQLICKV